MANIYDVNAAIQKPNLLQSFQQGQLSGERQKIARQQEVDQGTLRNLAPQIIAGDPGAFDQAAAIDPAAAEKFQGAGDQQLQRMKGAITYIDNARKSGNPRAVEAAYQQVRPYLARFGKEPPATFAEAEPMYEQAKARIAMLSGIPDKTLPTGFREFQMTAQAAGLQPGTPEYEQAANIALGREGRASNAGIGFKIIKGADGRERISRQNPRTGAVEVYNEQTGDFEPIGGAEAMGGAPAAPADPMAPLLQQANQAVQLGADPNKVEAWLQQQAQAMGLQTQAPGMMPQSMQEAPAVPQSAPPSVAGLAVSRTPEEEAAAVEAAKRGTGLQFLPQEEAIKTEAAIDQARGTAAAKTEAERQAAFPKNRAAVIAGNAELDRLAAAAKEVLDAPGLDLITGIPGMIPNRPGSPAANAQAKLDQLKSQVAFSVLQNMRNNSPTGGALGQVSDRENTMLENNLAALGREQSGAEYRKQLQKIIDYTQASKARRLDALRSTYGNRSDMSNDSSRVLHYNPATGRIE